MEELHEMIGEKKGRETNGLGWLEDGDHANGFLEKQVTRMHLCFALLVVCCLWLPITHLFFLLNTHREQREENGDRKDEE